MTLPRDSASEKGHDGYQKSVYWNRTRELLMDRARRQWPEHSDSELLARGIAALLTQEGIDISSIHGDEPRTFDERLRHMMSED